MAGRKRNINLYLMDGEPKGIIKITTKPWNGLLLRIPREKLYDCGERDEMKFSSIYFLIGSNESEDLPAVYVGQVGMRGILKRLTEHDKNPDKGYWTEAIVLTTSDNGFEATELNYLENTFYTLALNSQKCEVKNAVEPNPGNVKEENICGIEETIEVTRIIMELLGYTFFTPASSTSVKQPKTVVQQAPMVTAVAPLVENNFNVDTSKKIGKFVCEVFVKLLQSGLVPVADIKNLTSFDYCKQTFKKKIYYPILIEWPENSTRDEISIIKGYKRYYSDITLHIENKRYLLSSQWYDETYEYLIAWCKKFI